MYCTCTSTHLTFLSLILAWHISNSACCEDSKSSLVSSSFLREAICIIIIRKTEYINTYSACLIAYHKDSDTLYYTIHYLPSHSSPSLFTLPSSWFTLPSSLLTFLPHYSPSLPHYSPSCLTTHPSSLTGSELVDYLLLILLIYLLLTGSPISF